MRKTVELTLQSIIVQTCFKSGTYGNGSIKLQLTPDDIRVNGTEYEIAIDVGGGYNDLSQTMILPKRTSTAPSYYAIRQTSEGIELTPLQPQDGPVLIIGGEPFLLTTIAK